MSQFLRKLCTLFGQDAPKKTHPPVKNLRQPLEKTVPKKKKEAASTLRDSSPKPSKKTPERKRVTPVTVEEPMVRLRLLRMRKQVSKLESHEMEWGYVVGYVNQGKSPASLSNNPQMRIRIGPGGDITSLSALRMNCLDCLIFYCDSPNNTKLSELILSKQRLVVIAQSQSSLNCFLTAFEDVLLEQYGDQTLRKFGDKVSFNLIQVGSQKIVEFLGTEVFEQEFDSFMESSFAELKDYEQTGIIMDYMTVEEFQQCLTPHVNSVQKRITEYKEYIHEDLLKKAKKQQLLKVIADFQEQFRSRSPSPPHETQIITVEDSDQEVLYYSQLQSGKEFVDETSSTCIISYEVSQDLFYFIQEHSDEEDFLDQEHPKSRASAAQHLSSVREVPFRSSHSFSESRSECDDFMMVGC